MNNSATTNLSMTGIEFDTLNDLVDRVVYVDVAQSINSAKTFTSIPSCSIPPVVDSHLTNKTYVDTKVSLTGDETVAGVKTFSSVPVCSTQPTTNNELSNKQYTDTKVSLTGNETVAGVKTFSSVPVCSTQPTTNNQLANKIFVDTQINNLIGGAPDTLNTLNEIAEALADQANFSDLVVYKANPQTIDGNKTFSGTTTFTGNISANAKTISPTELGYLDGATSNIQQQINDINTGTIGDNLVHIDSVETITGAKTFTEDLTILGTIDTNKFLRVGESLTSNGYLKYSGTPNRIEIGTTNATTDFIYFTGHRDGNNLKLATNNVTKYEQTVNTTTLTNNAINVVGNLDVTGTSNLDGLVTIGGNANGDLLFMDAERDWLWKTDGTGAGTKLVLQDKGSNKNLEFRHTDDSAFVLFSFNNTAPNISMYSKLSTTLDVNFADKIKTVGTTTTLNNTTTYIQSGGTDKISVGNDTTYLENSYITSLAGYGLHSASVDYIIRVLSGGVYRDRIAMTATDTKIENDTVGTTNLSTNATNTSMKSGGTEKLKIENATTILNNTETIIRSGGNGKIFVNSADIVLTNTNTIIRSGGDDKIYVEGATTTLTNTNTIIRSGGDDKIYVEGATTTLTNDTINFQGNLEKEGTRFYHLTFDAWSRNYNNASSGYLEMGLQQTSTPYGIYSLSVPFNLRFGAVSFTMDGDNTTTSYDIVLQVRRQHKTTGALSVLQSFPTITVIGKSEGNAYSATIANPLLFESNIYNVRFYIFISVAGSNPPAYTSMSNEFTVKFYAYQ